MPRVAGVLTRAGQTEEGAFRRLPEWRLTSNRASLSEPSFFLPCATVTSLSDSNCLCLVSHPPCVQPFLSAAHILSSPTDIH